MYTPAQRAAIAIVHSVPAAVRFGAVSVTCDGILIGHVEQEYVAELTDTAKNAESRPELVFGPAIRGGVKTGVLDTIAVLLDHDDVHVIEMAGRTVELEIPGSGEFITIGDGYGNISIEMNMLDATIASMLALKARAEGR